MNCIFFNVETSLDNINSKDEKLGKIPRYYEEEAIRLIKSIRKFLPNIPIYTIFFKPLERYKNINFFKENSIISIPKLDKIYTDQISNFYSGFWFIPLSGFLMENSRFEKTENNRLYDINGNKIIPEKYGLKLDTDMYMLRDPFKKVKIPNKPVVCYYDKDFGDDCKERLKYGIEEMSNTCFIYSDLEQNIYYRWYHFLIDNDIFRDDLYEEVAFDIVFPITKTEPIRNIQIGENYLCWSDLNELERENILFYHQRMDSFKIDPILEVKLKKIIKQGKMNDSFKSNSK